MQTSDYFAKVLRAVLLAAAAVLVGLMAVNAHAQNSGTVGIQAVFFPVFTNQNTSASSGGYWNCGVASGPCPVLQDIGQGTNILSYCDTNFTGTIDLEWTPAYSPSATFIVITQATWTNDFGCHSLPFGGYFPNMRATLTGSGGSVSAWYTAISGPTAFAAPAIGSAGPTSPVQCDLNTIGTYASGAIGSSAVMAQPINRTDSVVICGMTVSFNGAASAGSIRVAYGTSVCASASNTTFQAYTTANTPQILNVPYPQRNAFVANNTPCFFNTSGASAEVSISYASVHVP